MVYTLLKVKSFLNAMKRQYSERGDIVRVQVNISEEMVQKIDEYAQKMGVSRSALCSVFVGQGIMSYEKYNDLLKVISDKVLEQAVGERKGI